MGFADALSYVAHKVPRNTSAPNNAAGFLGLRLALVAALFFALAPAIAPILSLASGTSSYLEICTSYGVLKKLVSGDFDIQNGDVQQDSENKGHSDKISHCVFCHFEQNTLLPTPSALIFPSLEANKQLVSSEALLVHSSPVLGYYATAPPPSSRNS